MSKHNKGSSKPAAPAPAPEPPKKGGKGGNSSASSSSSTTAAGAAGAPVKEPWFPKSKKAVLRNGGIVTSRGDRQVGDFTVKEWQRLPKQLLHEYLQGQKRPKCIYSDVPSTRNRVRIILPDPKGKAEKDIKLQPKQDYATRQEAEEYAAILALKHFTPTLPLERKFPEPFASAWLNFDKPDSVVTLANTFVSQAEKAQHETEIRKLQNEKEAKIENREKKYLTVFMSEENRTFIHDILRHLHQLNPQMAGAEEIKEAEEEGGEETIGSSSVTSSTTTTAATSSSISSPPPASSTAAADHPLLPQLEKLGFARSDALTALKANPGTTDLNTVLDHLMLTLPEHRLPKQFDPRGKQLEVIMHEKDDLSIFLGPGRCGIPKAICEAALEQSKGDIQLALLNVFNQLYSHLQPASFQAPDCAGRTEEEVEAAIEEEQMALESIFDTDYQRINSRGWSVKLKGHSLENVALEFLVPPTCKYPFQLPVMTIRCDHLSATQRLQLTAHLVSHIFSHDLLSNPLTFECHSWLTSELENLLRSPNLALPKNWLTKQKVLSEADKQSLAKMPQQPLTQAAVASLTSQLQASSISNAASSTASVSSSSTWGQDDEEDDDESFASSLAEVSSKSQPPRDDPKLNVKIAEDWQVQKQTPAYLDMLKIRQTLPVYKQKEKIIETCRKNQVVVLSGATGSGKSTQLPQFLLDAMFETQHGSSAHVLVTQPRRISAIGLAERVADERGEPCGRIVGYRIRGENKVSKETRLTFVTTGVLLRQLTSKSGLQNLSHIVIDEVHERSVEIDFLLLILKQTLKEMPWLKLVLMSATLDADVFSAYFGGCPTLNVEGRTFPVHDVYLEDILEDLKYVPDHKVRHNVKQEELEERVTQLKSKLRGNYELSTLQTLATLNIHRIDYKLIETLVWWLIDTKPLGGILIFLPGVYEITKLCGMLEQTSQVRETREKYWIIPLHGSLSSSNQQKVFANAPSNTRKIVVATNIAETSITVNDIIYVIDSGKLKQTEYDPERKMSSLVETFVSQAAANQRRGRAGRVKEGTCFRLFSSVVFKEVLPSHQLPELHRTALDHICLQIKLLQLDRAFSKDGLQKVLSLCVQPPTPAAVKSAIHTLQEAQALDERESLTPLGSHLARLPLDNVKIGKLLLFGAMFGCTTAMARCAAILSGKSIFNAPSDAREEADRRKMSFATGKSDALTMLKAFTGWLDARREGGNRAAHEFARKNFLSTSALESAEDLADSFMKGLEEIGFVVSARSKEKNVSERLALQDDQNDSVPVLSAVLTAGLYPNILSVDAPAEQYAKVLNGAVPIEQDSKLFKFFQRRPDGSRDRVFLHPRSINFKNQQYDSPWVTYGSMQETDKTYVHDCNIAYPYPLMLFGRSLETDLEKGLIIVDRWIHFRAPARIASLIRALRKYLTCMLEAKIANPHENIRSSPVIAAILRIINTNGF